MVGGGEVRWVKIRLHRETQRPGLPLSDLQSLSGGWVVQLELRLSWAVTKTT